MKSETPVSLRLSADLLGRADELLKSGWPEAGKASRSHVLRRAVVEGLAVLERLFKKVKSDPTIGVTGYAAVWRGASPDDSGWVATESMKSLQGLLERLQLPPPQLYQEVIVQPTVPEMKAVMEEIKSEGRQDPKIEAPLKEGK